MYNYFIFFLNVVPDASVDQKYTGKKRNGKESTRFLYFE